VSTLAEIKEALPGLSPGERAELAGLLAKTPKPEGKIVKLPDYAAQRRAIFGDRVSPVNAVLEARESTAA